MGSYWGADGKLVDGRYELSGRKAKVDQSSFDQVLNVAASGSTTITITPPLGELWRLRVLFFSIGTPTGSTSGTHSIIMASGSGIGNIMFGQSVFGSQVRFIYNHLYIADSSKLPINEQSQQAAILSTVVTNALPLLFTYSNNTNVAQTGTLQITLTREVEYIV